MATFKRSPQGIQGDQVSHNEAAVWTDKRRNVTVCSWILIKNHQSHHAADTFPFQ